MSPSRRTYCICYPLVVLALLAVLHFLQATPERSPQEQWRDFQPWLGPAPAELQAEKWNSDSDGWGGVIFAFRAAPEWQEHITRDFNLAAKDRDTAPLPAHWQAQLDPGQPALTTWPKGMLSADLTTGYAVQDMTLARLADGRSLLAFHFTWNNESSNPVFPRYESAPAKTIPDYQLALIFAALYAFCLVTPLGFLLLFPRFDLTRKRHIAWWFAAAALFPLPLALLFTQGIAFFILLWIIIGIPAQLVGAAVLLPLVMMIGFRSKSIAQ